MGVAEPGGLGFRGCRTLGCRVYGLPNQGVHCLRVAEPRGFGFRSCRT